jgi:hypothetical protein
MFGQRSAEGEKSLFHIHVDDGVSKATILSYGKNVRRKLTKHVATKITRLLREEIKKQKK